MHHHVLLLVNSYVTPKDPRRGAKFALQLESYARRGWNVGLMAAFQRDISLLECLRQRSFILHEQQFGRPVVRNCNAYTFGRFVRPLQRLETRIAYAVCSFESYMLAYGKPDLIHAHGSQWAGAVALQVKQKHEIPYVLTEHMSNYARGSVVDEHIPLMRQVFKEAANRLPISHATGRAIENTLGAAARPWFPLPNMTDIRLFQASNLPSGPTVFVTAGRLHPVKGYDVLLDAFAIAFAGGPQRLRIGGDGPLRGELERQALTLGIANQVVFLGQLSRSAVAEELSKASCYVLASHTETFGIPVLEAHASGKPVISTRCGGPEALIDESNGILVPPNDPLALADAMKAVEARLEQFDPILISNVVRKRYAPDAVLDQLAPIYETAVEQNS